MVCGDEKNIKNSVGLFLNDPKIVVPFLSDHKAHWCENRLSFAYVFNIRTHQELMLGFNHNDLYRFDKRVLGSFLGPDTFVFKKKYLMEFPNWEQLLDLELVHWYFTNERFAFDVDTTVRRYWFDYKDEPNVNDFVPVMRHLGTCRSIKDNIVTRLTNFTAPQPLREYQKISDNLSQIETNGLFTS